MNMETFSKSKMVLSVLLTVTAAQAMAEGDNIDIKVRGQFVPAA